MKFASRSVLSIAVITALVGASVGMGAASAEALPGEAESARALASASVPQTPIFAESLSTDAVAPSRVTVTSLTTGYAVSWSPGSVPGATGYNLTRTDSAGATKVVATLPLDQTMHRDETAVVGKSYQYRVATIPTVTDATGGTTSVAASAPSSGDIAKEIIATKKCPPTTVGVTTAAQLSAALLAASPGTVIKLAPGRYIGQFKLRNVDGGAARIWICGPSTAVVTTGAIGTGSALMLSNVRNVVVQGLSFTESQKGVTVVAGTRVTLRGITVTQIGYEAVHLRTQTVDSFVIGSRIQGAGKVEPKYGEGVYVGASAANWCTQNDCRPDRSDRIAVVDNVISETGAQPIEAKEGTSAGIISGNRVAGVSWMDSGSKGLVLVKGDDWQALNNQVQVVSGFGLGVIFSESGYGNDNVFGGNVVAGTPEVGLWANNPTYPTSGPTIYCSNWTTSSAPVSSTPCVP